MKQVPYKELVNVVINTTAFLPSSDGKLYATIYTLSGSLNYSESSRYFLDITLFADYRKRAAAGNFLHVPLLGGSNENEADLLIVTEELLTTGIVVPVITEELADVVTEVNHSIPTSRNLYSNIDFCFS